MDLQKGFRLGEWTVHPREGRVERAGDGAETAQRVRPKAIDVLCLLAAHAGEVVDRDTLLAEVWGRTAVSDEPLTATIGELRRLLGERRDGTRYIETIPKRGYRLLLQPEPLPGAATAAETAPSPAEPSPAPAPSFTDAPSGSAQGGSGAEGPGERSPGAAAGVTARARVPLRWRYGLAIALLFALAAALLSIDHGSGRAPGVAARSIAVLPFAVRGGSGDDAYFGDGLAQEVLSALAGFEGLRVAASNSAFSFRDARHDLAAIRAALDVGTVLDGSVMRDGERVRVQVQLVDTVTASTLWARSFERRSDDVFALQTEIASAIADELSIRLLDPAVLARRGQTTRAAAYDLYLQGLHAARTARTAGELQALRRIFGEALAHDPDFARARVELANAWMIAADLAYEAVEPAYAEARREVLRALEQAPQLAEAHRTLGWIQLYHDWDWQAAERSLTLAQGLQPESAEILNANAAINYHLGRLPRAVELARRAAERDPLRPGYQYNLAYMSFSAGELERSEQALERTLALRADFAGAFILRAQLALARGDPAAASAAAAQESHPVLGPMARALVAIARGDTATAGASIAALEAEFAASAPYQIAVLHAARGDADAAFLWLARAVEARDQGITELLVDPLLDPLREDPRFAALRARVGLAARG